MKKNKIKVRGFHGKVRIKKRIAVDAIKGFLTCLGRKEHLNVGEEYGICNNANRKERHAGVLERYFWDNEEFGDEEFCFTISREGARTLWTGGYLEIIDTYDCFQDSPK
jgi:hypothetical protein